MVSVLASSAVDRGFEPRSGQTKDYKIGICCFSAKPTVLRRKIKDWLAQNQDNVSEWGDMSICGLSCKMESFKWSISSYLQHCINTFFHTGLRPLMLNWFTIYEWVNACCLTPTQQFSHIFFPIICSEF
jgi:hypothetical protein